eukprot:6198823-Pleurochrysis_carterae.AAC.7
MAAAESADNIVSPTYRQRNFSRCTKCGDVEFALREARKRGGADKLAYYAYKCRAASILQLENSSKSASAGCAAHSFCRNPKKARKQLEDVMTVARRWDHTISASGRCAAPVPGRATLSWEQQLELLMSCACHEAPLDNASNNKSEWIRAFSWWMVKLGMVKEVHLSIMTVRHTHEDTYERCLQARVGSATS